EKDAWTFEYMALTRARVIAGSDELRQKLTERLRHNVCKQRNRETIAADERELRGKGEQEFGSKNPWDTKYANGGMMELDFIAQFIVLAHASEHAQLYAHSTQDVLMQVEETVLPDAHVLREALQFLNVLFFLLRLCGDGTLHEETAPQGLKTLLHRALG